MIFVPGAKGFNKKRVATQKKRKPISRPSLQQLAKALSRKQPTKVRVIK